MTFLFKKMNLKTSVYIIVQLPVHQHDGHHKTNMFSDMNLNGKKPSKGLECMFFNSTMQVTLSTSLLSLSFIMCEMRLSPVTCCDLLRFNYIIIHKNVYKSAWEIAVGTYYFPILLKAMNDLILHIQFLLPRLCHSSIHHHIIF